MMLLCFNSLHDQCKFVIVRRMDGASGPVNFRSGTTFELHPVDGKAPVRYDWIPREQQWSSTAYGINDVRVLFSRTGWNPLGMQESFCLVRPWKRRQS